MDNQELRDKAQKYQFDGTNFINNGEIDKGLEHLTKALGLYETLDDKYNLLLQYNGIAWIKRAQGELDQAQDMVDKQLLLSQQLNHKGLIAITYETRAYMHFYKGDLILAEKFARDSLDLYKEIESKEEILRIYPLFGSISRAKGDYEVALEYYTKALDVYNEEQANRKQVPHTYCYVHRCMGQVYFFQNKISKATECFKTAIKAHTSICLSRNSLMDYDLLADYTYLIYLGLATKDDRQVNNSLENLSILADKWPWGKLFWKMGKAAVLSSKERIKYKIQAQQLYEDILQEKFDYELEFSARYRLCDLLIDELKYSGTEEILLEIQDSIKRISKSATAQRSIYSLVILYYLQAKLALIEGNGEFANELLTKGITLAKSKGIGLYLIILENLQNELFIQLKEWKELLTRNSRLQEKVELLNLKNDLTEAITDVLEKKFMTQLDPLKLDDEISTLLLILGKGGVQIFSFPFTDEGKFDDELLGSFLTAFDSFSGEAFSEALDRAKFGDYTVVMEPVESYTVCYLFKGQAYVARQKLIKFIKGIQKNYSIIQTLNKFHQSSQVIETNNFPVLESLVKEIFIRK